MKILTITKANLSAVKVATRAPAITTEITGQAPWVERSLT